MATMIKDKVAKAAAKATNTADSSSSSGSEASGEKYILKVSAGPSYDPSTHYPVVVNSNEATAFENDFMTVKIKVRIRGYKGLPRNSPSHTPYFDHPTHAKDQYSVGFSFVPKVDINGEDLVWGNDFDHPVRDRLPPGTNYAINIVKSILDPGIEADAYADKPWLYSPALDCWFVFRIGEKMTAEQLKDIPHAEEEHPLEEGADGSGQEIRTRLGIPPGSKRRKFYLSAAHRREFTFEKGRLYQGDFFNPYLDFNKLAVKLPGFSLKVVKYVDDKTHNLRYVFKNGKNGDVFFVVNIVLLFGEEMRVALAEEDQRSRAASLAPSVDERQSLNPHHEMQPPSLQPLSVEEEKPQVQQRLPEPSTVDAQRVVEQEPAEPSRGDGKTVEQLLLSTASADERPQFANSNPGAP